MTKQYRGPIAFQPERFYPPRAALFDFDPSVVPDIEFIQKDASVIQSEVVSDYEKYFYLITRINKTLGRADPVRLFLLNVIYQMVVQRNWMEFAAKSNLIKYARGDFLDNIAARWGPTRGRRLEASKAQTTLRFSISSLLSASVFVPFGTRAQTNEGIEFRTTAEGEIPSGSWFCDVLAEAINVGELGNDILPGQITNIVTPNLTFVTDVTNTTTSVGGAPRETDDRYRARIWMAPESFTNAGSYGAYSYWAATANASIADVSVWSDPEHAGQVFIYPLMYPAENWDEQILPSQEVLDQVYAQCNADYIRPLTDQVFVMQPMVKRYPLKATFWISPRKQHFELEIYAAIYKAFDEFKMWQKSKIGRDINPSRMIQMLINAGASRVGLISPMLDDVRNRLSPREIAIADPAELTYAGLEPETDLLWGPAQVHVYPGIIQSQGNIQGAR